MKRESFENLLKHSGLLGKPGVYHFIKRMCRQTDITLTDNKYIIAHGYATYAYTPDSDNSGSVLELSFYCMLNGKSYKYTAWLNMNGVIVRTGTSLPPYVDWTDISTALVDFAEWFYNHVPTKGLLQETQHLKDLVTLAKNLGIERVELDNTGFNPKYNLTPAVLRKLFSDPMTIPPAPKCLDIWVNDLTLVSGLSIARFPEDAIAVDDRHTVSIHHPETDNRIAWYRIANTDVNKLLTPNLGLDESVVFKTFMDLMSIGMIPKGVIKIKI